MQRRKTVDMAFALRADAYPSLAGQSVLLVDDVHTSGSTGNVCARLLKKAGAEEVFVFSWTRVICSFENG